MPERSEPTEIMDEWNLLVLDCGNVSAFSIALYYLFMSLVVEPQHNCSASDLHNTFHPRQPTSLL
jgi:hypothetical protein